MSPIVVDLIGGVAALCSTASFAPQLVKIWRDKDGGEVSLGMYVLTVSAFVLWSLYGLALGSWPLTAANLVSLVLASAILVLKLRYQRRAEPAADPHRRAHRGDRRTPPRP